jgi:hypothetical protein
MALLPLDVVVNSLAANVAELLEKCGTKTPECVNFIQNVTIPKVGVVNGRTYAQSGEVLFTNKIKAQLHKNTDSENAEALETKVLTNPCPKPFSDRSIALLKALEADEDDGVMASKPVEVFLEMRWLGVIRPIYFGFIAIYLVYFGLVITVALSTHEGSQTLLRILLGVTNGILFVWECLQIWA